MVLGLVYDIVFGAPLVLCREIVRGMTAEIAREALLTEQSVKERLQQLLLMLDAGELSEEEYETLEAGLMVRLRAIRGAGEKSAHNA